MKRGNWLGPLALLVLGACSGEGNTGRPAPNLELWSLVPWADHATPQFKADGSVKIASEPYFPPIASDLPDPGSHAVDCSPLDDIELSPYYLDNFEPLGAGAEKGMAPGWSGYDDGSDGAFRVPGDVDWYPGWAGKYGASTFGLAADVQVGERPMCQLDAGGNALPNDWTLHYRGGRFNYYGGGMAHAFAAERADPATGLVVVGCPPGSDLCPCKTGAANCDATERVKGSEPTDVFPDAYKQLHIYYDASTYDGIAFWARRGPEGATGLLVGLQDKHTSDDLARENETFCKRIKVCVPDCVNGNSCIKQDDADANGEEIGLFRCMPPKYDVTKVINPALREFLFPRCGASTCVSPNFYKDGDFDGTECQATSFSGLETGYWCSSAEKPAAPDAERCGDAFVQAISMSTDWKLYKLPFESFRQVGFGKKAPSFDLHSLYSIAFQFTVGYTDVYVDNLSFYRNKK